MLHIDCCIGQPEAFLPSLETLRDCTKDHIKSAEKKLCSNESARVFHVTRLMHPISGSHSSLSDQCPRLFGRLRSLIPVRCLPTRVYEPPFTFSPSSESAIPFPLPSPPTKPGGTPQGTNGSRKEGVATLPMGSFLHVFPSGICKMVGTYLDDKTGLGVFS